MNFHCNKIPFSTMQILQLVKLCKYRAMAHQDTGIVIMYKYALKFDRSLSPNINDPVEITIPQ